jgi:hypothetical protein
VFQVQILLDLLLLGFPDLDLLGFVIDLESSYSSSPLWYQIDNTKSCVRIVSLFGHRYILFVLIKTSLSDSAVCCARKLCY